jgi:hypothetical protein
VFAQRHPELLHHLRLVSSDYYGYYTINNSLVEPRRAAVALILRVVPPPNYFVPEQSSPPSKPPSIQEFFEVDWVNAPGARAEILYLRRTKGDSDRVVANGNGKPQDNGARKKKRDTESHVAFPGGRMEEGDEDGLYTGKPSSK